MSNTGVSRWLTTILGLAATDNKKFKNHSFKSASSSEETSMGLSVQDMLTQAHRSGDSVWQKHYQKEIVKNSEIFQKSILSNI